ncbi:NUDIX hydrolase [Shewanella japonica]|uniref:NUDIX hydrolase n=2 Tax=Shewanellaceae TaxID=267890 RepID=A0ABM6JGM2_9GAMM|nr:NUDIX hydrolase [Shewanella japonica]
MMRLFNYCDSRYLLMRHLKTTHHPDTPIEFVNDTNNVMLTRRAARAIVLQGQKILMLYTARYHDYSLPGGGVDDHEDIEQGLVRELSEETGARDIRNINEFGLYEEYRPWARNGANLMHMLSYCYTCEIDQELGDTQFEQHEINNGMKPVWMDIDQAIQHNLDTMANSDKKGLSIERETFLLKLIKQELL